jgi:hypothetical protein
MSALDPAFLLIKYGTHGPEPIKLKPGTRALNCPPISRACPFQWARSWCVRKMKAGVAEFAKLWKGGEETAGRGILFGSFFMLVLLNVPIAVSLGLST